MAFTKVGRQARVPDRLWVRSLMAATTEVMLPEVTAVGVRAANGVPFVVRVVSDGERYGRDGCLVHGDPENKVFRGSDAGRPSVEFYDARYPDIDEWLGLGQFTGARYFVSTLLGDDGYGSGTGGLDLVGYEPSWKIDAQTMEFVRSWLREVTA